MTSCVADGVLVRERTPGRLVRLAPIVAVSVLTGCTGSFSSGCEGGAAPEHAADALVRDYVTGGRAAAAAHFASFARPLLKSLPPSRPGQDPAVVVASRFDASRSMACTLGAAMAEEEGKPVHCFGYSVKTAGGKPPYDFIVALDCVSGDWLLAGGSWPGLDIGG